MNKKYLIMAGIAVFFGSVSIVAADYWLKSNVKTVVKEVEISPDIPPAILTPEKTIVVAGQALSYGDPLTKENLREVAWAAEALPVGAYQTIDEMLEDGDRNVLNSIELGEPVLTSRITGPGARPSLSTIVSPGMRAMAIRIDPIAGVSGFIVPGDRVDVMLVRRFNQQQVGDTGMDLVARAAATPNARTVPGQENDVVLTSQVLTNVKVLSIDQIASDRQSDPVIASSATLEVTPSQASLVSSAQEAGSLTLHLRPAGNPQNPAMANLPENGIDLNQTSAFEPTVVEPRKTSTSIRVRMGEEMETHEVRIEGMGQ